MPHTHADTLSLPVTCPRPGDSRFARPVAIITAVVRKAGDAVWSLVSPHSEAPTPRSAQELAVRGCEERYVRATDHADLERMQRAFDRRDGDRAWE